MAALSIGAGLPPVPCKIVKRIQSGEFIDMAELLPDRLGIRAGTTEKDDKAPRLKRRQVTSILEWIQCYSIYTAVVCAKCPERIQDMLGYQALIMEACMEYEGDSWLGYDRRFRQTVSASPGATWAKIDPTLWNMAFTGQAKARRCKHCFSLSHLAEDCDWAPTPPTQLASSPVTSKPTPRSRSNPICYSSRLFLTDI